MPPLSVYYSFLIFKLTFRTTLRKTLSSISSTRAISAHHLSSLAHSFLTSKLVAASVWCGSPRSEQRWPNVRFSSCRKCKQNSVENSYHSVQAVSHSIIVGNHRSQCIYILSRLGPPTNPPSHYQQPHRIAAKNMLSNQICPRNCFPSFQLCLYKEHIPLQRRQWFHFSILHFSLHIHLFGLWFTPMLLKSCLIFFWCVSLRCNSSQLSPLQSLQSVQRSTRSTFQQITAIFKSPFFPSSVSHFFMSAGAAFDFSSPLLLYLSVTSSTKGYRGDKLISSQYSSQFWDFSSARRKAQLGTPLQLRTETETVRHFTTVTTELTVGCRKVSVNVAITSVAVMLNAYQLG